MKLLILLAITLWLTVDGQLFNAILMASRRLKLSIPEKALSLYLSRQLELFFPDGQTVDLNTIESFVNNAIQRLKVCFEPITLKYYVEDGSSVFNHLNGDQYSVFLYLVSNSAYKNGDLIIASKIFLLNKSLFGIDAFYSIKLPEHFIFVHPLGTVLGNASYGDYFIAYQGVTVGGIHGKGYPSFSESTVLYSNSSILGNCTTGSGFVMAANATLINSIIPDNSIILGNYPNYRIIANEHNVICNFFDI